MIPSGWCRCWSACNYTSLYYCSLTLYCNDKFFFIKRNFERILITPKMHKHFFCFCKNARGTDILKPTLTSSQSHVPRQRKPFKNNVFSIVCMLLGTGPFFCIHTDTGADLWEGEGEWTALVPRLVPDHGAGLEGKECLGLGQPRAIQGTAGRLMSLSLVPCSGLSSPPGWWPWY